MKLFAGIVLFLLSFFLCMLMVGLSEFYPQRSDAVIFIGLAFAWCGPFLVLGVVLMHNSVRLPGRLAYLIYIAAVLAFMTGLVPSLQRAPNIYWPQVISGLVIGGLVLAGILFCFMRRTKPTLAASTPHDSADDRQDLPDV